MTQQENDARSVAEKNYVDVLAALQKQDDAAQAAITAAKAETAAVQQAYDDHMKTHTTTPPPESGPTLAELREAYGVCAPFVPNPTAYADPNRWMAELNKMGVKKIRGLFVQSNANCRLVLNLCRQYGMTWHMVVTGEGWGSATSAAAYDVAFVTTRLKWLHDNGWHDVVHSFESKNEPDAKSPPSWWPQGVVKITKAIKAGRDQWFPDAEITSSSLHDLVQDQQDGAGYKALADAGLAPLVDIVALHSYSKGKDLTFMLDERLLRVDKGFPNHDVWLTEFGWFTHTGGGAVATTEADMAKYVAESPYILAKHPRVKMGFKFELLDDAPSGPTSNFEARGGDIRPDWSRKPSFAAVQKVLGGQG